MTGLIESMFFLLSLLKFLFLLKTRKCIKQSKDPHSVHSVCDRERDIIINGGCIWSFIMQNDPDDQLLVENCKRRKGSDCHISGKKSIFMNSLTFPLIS